MERIRAFFYKYRHMWLLSYGFIYLPWFCYLERTVTHDYHIMHAPLDDLIPFNEYFIIPYIAWFVFVAGTLLSCSEAEKITTGCAPSSFPE